VGQAAAIGGKRIEPIHALGVNLDIGTAGCPSKGRTAK
jgi:hypothetical protein